jgi:hypothetical protein
VDFTPPLYLQGRRGWFSSFQPPPLFITVLLMSKPDKMLQMNPFFAKRMVKDLTKIANKLKLDDDATDEYELLVMHIGNLKVHLYDLEYS